MTTIQTAEHVVVTKYRTDGRIAEFIKTPIDPRDAMALIDESKLEQEMVAIAGSVGELVGRQSMKAIIEACAKYPAGTCVQVLEPLEKMEEEALNELLPKIFKKPGPVPPEFCEKFHKNFWNGAEAAIADFNKASELSCSKA